MYERYEQELKRLNESINILKYLPSIAKQHINFISHNDVFFYILDMETINQIRAEMVKVFGKDHLDRFYPETETVLVICYKHALNNVETTFFTDMENLSKIAGNNCYLTVKEENIQKNNLKIVCDRK